MTPLFESMAETYVRDRIPFTNLNGKILDRNNRITDLSTGELECVRHELVCAYYAGLQSGMDVARQVFMERRHDHGLD